MHLLAAQPGGINDGTEAVDLGQSPGDIVVLSAADTELAALATARETLATESDGAFPTLRLASLLNLGHNLSVDTYVADVIAHASLVIVRLLGGVSYWPYGVERVVAACRERGIKLALLPGDDQPDAELASHCLLPRESCHRLWQYAVHGGAANARNMLAYGAHLIGYEVDWVEPAPILRAGLYWPGEDATDLAALRAHWRADAPVAAVVFYRALWQAANLAPVDALIEALSGRGLNPLPVFAASLKDALAGETIRQLFADAPPDVILNATGFAVSSPGATRRPTPFDGADCPVIQVVFSGGTEAAWQAGTVGLAARDLAMNVVLPEIDGRIMSRAVSFKTEARFDPATETALVRYATVPDRINFVAALAGNWARLRRAPAGERRVALILANYPNRDGRIGNGVGLDTPASTHDLLRALDAAGYHVPGLPTDGAALIRRLAAGPTNRIAGRATRTGGERLSLAAYRAFFATLPESVRRSVVAQWGAPEDDPHLADGAFAISALRFGNVIVGIQPARGYNIDPVRTYHDPALVPPHYYLAFYGWLREAVDVHVVIHMGKHGNLEWLPGKAVALSEACFPDAAFGPLPHLYPFIVNDPGEGTQAKRRAQAVIIDHLTPPLTRAETYGPLAELEFLIDEYYEAAGMDRRRLELLRDNILEITRKTGLDRDSGAAPDDDADAALGKLDNYLCELKEMQIRDGLHIFGTAPEGAQLTDLLVALTRLPRTSSGGGKKDGGDESLIRALAGDLGLTTDSNGFDPLDCEFAVPWTGKRPDILANGLKNAAVWRSNGDTVERLERLAHNLVAGATPCDPAWTATVAVLAAIERDIRPAVETCGPRETAAVLTALDGRFVEPGPSGAPTRGRVDVLPTGRNFYSVDSRVVPTPAAWTLGWKSATLLIERHRQEHGDWPRRLALTAWGTSNMRTGGDDIAQALALMGVRPTWETASRRVTGFEIMPLSVLDRPRVDVTLRVSGFFRDAFPMQIDLFDSAVRAVAALIEPAAMNPLAARVARDTERFAMSGMDQAVASRRAGFRVFGSKPGAYGAGLQALIDERGWDSEADLARAYIAWGGYAYGDGAEGDAAHPLFESLLKDTEAVVHNQDNREHDILDSDDYYQFEGGIAAAIHHLSGTRPTVYHNDHSRPERPVIRTLDEEVARVVRSRVVNPKWIEGVMRHGYKGAFEMSATVDYLFAFAATTGAVADHHFDLVFEAYLEDSDVREFLVRHNPAAAHDIAARLNEAQDRGLWRPRSNSVHGRLGEFARAFAQATLPGEAGKEGE
jgi:cobaltochelatase CobN